MLYKYALSVRDMADESQGGYCEERSFDCCNSRWRAVCFCEHR